jgi:hypothetical protein
MVTMKNLNFFEVFEILKFCENLEIFIFFILEFRNFLKI